MEKGTSTGEKGYSLKTNRFFASIAIVQAFLGIRVIWRLICTMGGERIYPVVRKTETNLVLARPAHNLTHAAQDSEYERVWVIVPVLNERSRLEPCLDGLVAQGEEVTEIIVVDGGSDDGTQELVSRYIHDNARICLVDASPIPPGWNGKAWGLQVGLCSAMPDSNWILTVDADVRPQAPLTLSLLEQAKKKETLSIECSNPARSRKYWRRAFASLLTHNAGLSFWRAWESHATCERGAG